MKKRLIQKLYCHFFTRSFFCHGDLLTERLTQTGFRLVCNGKIDVTVLH